MERHADGQTRAYRVARILDLTVLDQWFERPKGFDLAVFWQAWSEEFTTRIYPETAIVRLSPHGLALLPSVVDPPKARAARASAESPEADGWTRVRLPTESIQHALVDVLKFGADAEALAPPELRRRLAETARVLIQRYENDESGVRDQESALRCAASSF